jgi:hypothetical protein
MNEKARTHEEKSAADGVKSAVREEKSAVQRRFFPHARRKKRRECHLRACVSHF